MKRLIMMLLSLTMLISSFSIVPVHALEASTIQDDISLYTGEINFNDGITKAEWLTALTRAYQMEVEDDNYPDNYFSDLDSSSPFYYDLLLAVNFGLVNVEAGEALLPNEPVTREFAVQTLNFCIAYQNEKEDYSFSDKNDVTYLDDAQVAIDQGWLQLSGGKFLPSQLVTASEATLMIDIAKKAYDDIQIIDNYENTYDYSHDVIVFDENIVADYDGANVVIYDTSQSLKMGSKYSVYLNGIPVVFEALEVTNKDNSIIVESKELSVYEGFDNLDAQGEMSLSAIEVGKVEGLDVSFEEEEVVSPYTARGAIHLGKKAKLSTKGKIKIVKGTDATIDFELSDAKLEYKFTTNETYIKLSGKSEFSYGIESNVLEAADMHEVTILPATFPGVGGLDIIGEFEIGAQLNGKTEGYLVTGVAYSKNDGFRHIREFKAVDFYLTCEASGSVGVKVRLGITGELIPVKGYLWAKAGGKVKFVSNNYSSGTPAKCQTFAAWMYAGSGATVSIDLLVFSKSYDAEVEIFDEYNSPLRIYHHYEDGVEVCECTRDKDSFKYYTPSSSRYHGSGSHSGSRGFDKLGGLFTLYDYTLDENNDATITKYYGSARTLYIPKTIDGYKVVGIGDRAFSKNDLLYEVVIPETVTLIGNGAFLDCLYLHKVSLPKDINTAKYVSENYMYPGPFEGCVNLTSVKFAEGTTMIDDGLLYKTGLKKISIPKTVTSIGLRSFAHTKLTSVKMENSLTHINGFAFNNCDLLEEVVLPDSVTFLGIGAFSRCDNLSKINIPKDVNVGQYAGENYMYPGPFSECMNLKNVVFEEGTTILKQGLLSESGIEEITIPSTVTTIEARVFYNCSALETVQFNNALKNIGWYAFLNCTSLKEAILPKGLRLLQCGAFEGCTSLEKVFIPLSMQLGQHIGSNYMYPTAFTKCSSLKTVEFEEGMKTILPFLLNNTGIETISIPDSVEVIGMAAFENCTLLKDIQFSKNIHTIEARAFKNTGFETIVIPETVESMGTNVLENCINLKNVTLPSSAKTIMQNTFSGCSSLEEMTLPKGVVSIQAAAFKNCTALKKVDFGNDVREILDFAFENCDSLIGFTIPDTVVKLGNGVFYECDGLEEFTMSNNITAIGDRLFEACDNLVTVKLSTGINTITKQMFMHCDKLDHIVLPYSIQYIKPNAFKDCVELKNITIPQATTSIDSNAFSYYDVLTISGVEGSFANTFANENNAEFISINKPATILSLNKNEIQLNRYDNEQLILTVEPYDMSDVVTFISSDNNIVEVTNTGVIKAKNIGEATIKVIAGNKSAMCKVKVVQPVTRINLNKYTLTLQGGDSFKLEASLSPNDANNKKIEFTSSNNKVVKVDENGNITALKKGTATITVMAMDGSNVSNTCKVTVENDVIMVSDVHELESQHNYDNNASIIYVYEVNKAGKLDVTFDARTHVEDGFDYIKIFNHKNELVNTYTGTELAGKTISVTGNTVKIQLISDDAGSEWGFKVIDVVAGEVEKPFPFEDVFIGQWYYEYVDQAYQLGLMTGATETLFKPTVSMNRGMVAIVLHRMEGAEKVAYAPIFPDVYNNQYFTTAVMWAKQTGIITGYNNGTFMPLKNVTREEMATMIQRFAKYKGLDVTSSKDITYFKDYADISTYAKAPIQWCVENGVLSGKFEGTKVDPLGTATRAECAKMLVQAYKVIYK